MSKDVSCTDCGLCCKLFDYMCLYSKTKDKGCCIHLVTSDNETYSCNLKHTYPGFVNNVCHSKENESHEFVLNEMQLLEQIKAQVDSL